MTSRRAADLTVGFVSGRFCHRRDGELFTDSGVAGLLNVLSRRCGKLVVSMSASPHSMSMLTSRVAGDAEAIDLPFIPSAAAGVFRAREVRAVIASVEERCDALIVQLPFSPVLALLGPRRPRVYHVCADVAGLVRSSRGYTGPRRIAAVGTAELTATVHRRLVHAPDTRVVTNGRALHELLDGPPGVAAVSTALRERELGSVTRSRPPGAPFRILFAGYLRPEKGIDVLVEAYERVLATLPEAELVFVGNEPVTGIGGGVEALLERARRGGRIVRKGYLPYGPELFQEYADSDVLALPSRSEGTPRVLVEARAFGCPVVATRVGGIPSSIRDGVDGLLVGPGDASELAEAILRVAGDRSLRERLILQGFERARATTVERFVDTLLAQLGLLVDAT